MEVLDILRRALKACASAIKVGSNIQGTARKELTIKLQTICLNCENAYDTVLSRLVAVKDAFESPDKLSRELRAFASDKETRDAFKPEHLCSEVDHLLVRLQDNLDPLKYSIAITRIKEVRADLGRIVDFDGAIYAAFDGFARQLDELATQIHAAQGESNGAPRRETATGISFATPERGAAAERLRYAQHVIAEFEQELRATIDEVREIKTGIASGV